MLISCRSKKIRGKISSRHEPDTATVCGGLSWCCRPWVLCWPCSRPGVCQWIPVVHLWWRAWFKICPKFLCEAVCLREVCFTVVFTHSVFRKSQSRTPSQCCRQGEPQVRGKRFALCGGSKTTFCDSFFFFYPGRRPDKTSWVMAAHRRTGLSGVLVAATLAAVIVLLLLPGELSTTQRGSSK